MDKLGCLLLLLLFQTSRDNLVDVSVWEGKKKSLCFSKRKTRRGGYENNTNSLSPVILTPWATSLVIGRTVVPTWFSPREGDCATKPQRCRKKLFYKQSVIGGARGNGISSAIRSVSVTPAARCGGAAACLHPAAVGFHSRRRIS